MPIYTWRTSSLARDIYLYGNRTFQQVPVEYVEPIKQYAANTFDQDDLDNALTNGWITQQEYNDTMAYKNPA
jgi:predicted RNA-binding protein associated with RNAse of E/G family